MPIPQLLLDECDRPKPVIDELRTRALERLYIRRAVVDDLIRSLENYERFPIRKGRAECIPIRKYS
jgi:hypothetical protein